VLGLALPNVSIVSLNEVTTTIVGVITIKIGYVLCILPIPLLVNARWDGFPEILTRAADLELGEISLRFFRLEHLEVFIVDSWTLHSEDSLSSFLVESFSRDVARRSWLPTQHFVHQKLAS